MENHKERLQRMGFRRDASLNNSLSSQASRRDQSPSPSDSVSNMSDDGDEFDPSRQDPEYEHDGGRDLDLADLRLGMQHDSQGPESLDRVGSDNKLIEEPSLSGRSNTQSYDDGDSVNGEYSEPEGTFKSQAPEDEVEHLAVERVWSNDAIWTPPSPEAEDEVGILIDEDEDDDEGGWGQHSSSGSIRSSSDYAQSKANLRAIVDGHFRALVAHLLQEHEIPPGEEGDPNSWLQIVSTLALQSANLVKPNTSLGGGMDPGGYVKVKCIASGRCGDSTVVKGVVCHKNVQNRRMISRFKNPRLLLLGGALEYQRTANQLSSLDSVLQQEIDYLKEIVARIDAHHPDVLLVEKTVAGFAQDALLKKEVSVVLKMKRPLLERIARCTGAQVVSSLDNLVTAKAGQCEQFHIEKFDEEHNAIGPGSKKTSKYLMFFEGCPRPLGCTILLRGASTDELKKVKKVVQFAVFAAYHLALETSFLVDEGATLPYFPTQTVAPSKLSTIDSSISSISGFTIPTASRAQMGRNDSTSNMAAHGNSLQMEKVSGNLQQDSGESLDSHQQSVVDEFPPSSPDYQSILVLLSSRIFSKGTVCEKPQLKRIKYYGASDKPLGKFLKDFLINTSTRCGSCDEPMEAHEHRYTHPHGSLTISSKILKNFALAGGKEGKIWMWHRCLRCPRLDKSPPPTRRIPMSDSALDLSFGKFLELSFSNHAAASRIASCGHSVHKDCLRFFGLGSAVACFHYSPIKLHTVHVPPPQLEFNHPNEQDWLRVEVSEIAELGDVVFAEAIATLRKLGCQITSLSAIYTSKAPKARSQLAELEALLEKERAEFTAQLEKAAPIKVSPYQAVADILALNKLRRYLASVSGVWDSRVQSLVSYLQSQNVGRSAGFDFDDVDTAISMKEADGGVASKPEVPEVPLVEPESLESAETGLEDSSGLKESSTAVLDTEGTPGDGQSLEADPSAQTVNDSGVEDDVHLVEENEGQDQKLVHALALEKQTSSPLPLNTSGIDESCFKYGEESPESEPMKILATASSASPVVGDLSATRSLSEGHFPILVDLPDTLEAHWRGEGGSIDATAVESTKQELVEALAGTEAVSGSSGKETGISDLASMTTASSSPEGDQGEVAGVLGEVDTETSVPTSPLKDKEGGEESGVPAGGSFATLYKGYSRSSSVPSSISSLSFQYKHSASSIITIGQIVDQATARVRLPTGVNDIVVAVYDDEPTSVIAYAITSTEYQAQLHDPERERSREKVEDREGVSGPGEGVSSVDVDDEGFRSATPPLERPSTPKGWRETSMDDSLVSPIPITVKVRFTDTGQQGKAEFRVICYYAKQFIALRAKCCGGELEYVRSLSRCKKWGAQGGKSNAFFAKTMDDRFIVKQVSSSEKYSFLEFAPHYFSHLCDSLNSGSPTCLAKILGFYTVTVKQARGAKEKEVDLLVMENLLYGRRTTRLYDLKGSSRSRYNADASGINKVLLDQNLLEAMPTSPIFVSNKAKLLLERAVYNDTSFLAKVNVMDYSLLVGIDEERQELVVGIIDFLRQYTWDKHLETWVKASGILGGPKNAMPTVISPKEYKKRFRKAMSNYFVVVPEFETPPIIPIVNPPSDLLPSDENQQPGGS
jgi:1-phosphatidylinositol-3-phosphate 5-kinase